MLSLVVEVLENHDPIFFIYPNLRKSTGLQNNVYSHISDFIIRIYIVLFLNLLNRIFLGSHSEVQSAVLFLDDKIAVTYTRVLQLPAVMT